MIDMIGCATQQGVKNYVTGYHNLQTKIGYTFGASVSDRVQGVESFPHNPITSLAKSPPGYLSGRYGTSNFRNEVDKIFDHPGFYHPILL